MQYQIEPSVRCHEAPLNRQVVIDAIGPLVRALAAPPSPSITPASPMTNGATVEAIARPLLNVTANLKTPNLVLLPIVLRNVYSLGIVEGTLWSGEGKKLNLETMASAARISLDALSGPTAVRGVVLPAASVVEE